jgi:hypothetical protein
MGLLSLFRQVVLIRHCEEQLARAYQMRRIHGPCHTYVGQETVAVGVCAHLRTDDTIFSIHRSHGHVLAKGVSAREVCAELLGRATGCSQGRGGSMHLFKSEVGLMGTSGIVGPSMLQATGAGYSFKLLKTDRVAVAFFGDGAVNNGAFHEGLNMESIWQLPVLFISDDPVLFLEHQSLLFSKRSVPEKTYTIPFGQARTARRGTDCTIVAIGSMVGKTLEACNQLIQQGIQPEIIDPRTLAPLDMETILASVGKTGRLLIVDETFQPCGIGAEIAAQVIEQSFDDLDAPIRRLNGVHVPTPYTAVVPQVDTIAESALSLMAE